MKPPAIYCVNLASETGRRERMERRLRHHGLLERAAFVSGPVAVEPSGDPEFFKAASGRACLVAHLTCMERMLDEVPASEGGAIICEDDVLIHDEFAERLAAALANLPAGTNLCSLGFMLDEWPSELVWRGEEPERRNLCPIVPGVTWGTHGYWISHAYARALVARRGSVPLERLDPVAEREVTFPANGLAVYPPLMLQEATDSLLRPSEKLDFHVRGQRGWSYRDYSASEPNPAQSPLAALPDPGRTIGLAMIVRDEAEVIERCIESVRPLISTWTICDTGSTDGTPELIEELLADLPGTLHRTEWRDFGANRTELMELARGTADYLLLVDADMTVDWRGPLPPLEADSYMLPHGGGLGYRIPRLVRGSRSWHYVGATHEYLAAEGEIDQRPLDALAIVHWADGGTRGEKFERDRRLLERQLEEQPDDPRTVFYLAQTLRDLGERERAAELYTRRASLGAWDEEAFYAAYQAGALLAGNGRERAEEQLLAAAAMRPTRAEPYFDLARLARYERRYEAALEYADRGLDIPEPHDLLFVHRDIYQWRLRLERAIALYWLGSDEDAIAECDRLLTTEGLPGDEIVATREVRGYALARLPEGEAKRAAEGWGEQIDSLVPSIRHAEIELDVEPDWPRFNPSIAADPETGGFRMIVRSANYDYNRGRYISRTGETTIRTLNYLALLDEELTLTGVEGISDSDAGPERFETLVVGYEDCRLVRVGERWFAVATVRDRSEDMICKIALLDLDGARIERVRLLPGPDPARHEKNWMPFELADGRLGLVYGCGPAITLACDLDSGELEEIARHEVAGTAEFRGGSQLVPVDGGHLALIHEVAETGTGRIYSHRFVRFDGEHRPVAVSQRFRFSPDPVELVEGIAIAGDRCVISYGVGDAHAMLAVCDLDEVLATLEPLAPKRKG